MISNRELERVAAVGTLAQSVDTMRHALSQWVDDMRKKPVRELLGPLPEYVHRIANNIGKSVDFQIIGGQTRVPALAFKPPT